jgi:hypothetical protein
MFISLEANVSQPGSRNEASPLSKYCNQDESYEENHSNRNRHRKGKNREHRAAGAI